MFLIKYEKKNEKFKVRLKILLDWTRLCAAKAVVPQTLSLFGNMFYIKKNNRARIDLPYALYLRFEWSGPLK